MSVVLCYEVTKNTGWTVDLVRFYRLGFGWLRAIVALSADNLVCAVTFIVQSYDSPVTVIRWSIYSLTCHAVYRRWVEGAFRHLGTLRGASLGRER